MPRFGIRAQFALLSLGLIAIPLVGLNYWDAIQKSAFTAQTRIQEIEAKAIVTTLLATQQNIGELLAADEDSDLDKHSLSVPSIKQPIRLDGQFGDWPQQALDEKRFSYDEPVWVADPNANNEAAFSLLLAQSSQYLFVAMDVRDDKIAFRKPNHLRLDYNDHIQLSYEDESDNLRRIIIPAEREGAVASYYTDEQWQYGRDWVKPGTELTVPSHRTGIQGFWRKTDAGYALEFRLPISQIKNIQPQIRFEVVDVDDKPAFGPQAIVASLPKRFRDQLNPVALHARELQRVIDQLKHTYARLWIYDSQGREWAFAERDPQVSEPYSSFEHPRSTFDSQCVKDALQGTVNPQHLNPEHLYQASGQSSRLIVCYPIEQDGKVLGVVVIDESADRVLEKERARVSDIAMQVGLVLAGVLLVLLFYAFTLVRRISKLSQEAKKSIDSYGRIERTEIKASSHFPDEIGDLSRSMSELLKKQQSYMHFLERMPQTLRHEISNPLNKLRTSLENLLDHHPEMEEDKYIRKLDAGIDQITKITVHLTEAASLESAIQQEQLVKMDLVKFLKGYCSAWEGVVTFCLKEQRAQDQSEPVWIKGDSSRLEQLFDKLLDNATSFCPDDGQILISMSKHSNTVTVSVENDGPLLPTENAMELFSPMVSTRSTGSDIHLGLGLHIAKLISQHHGASLVGKNREDGTGVVFSVSFDLLG